MVINTARKWHFKLPKFFLVSANFWTNPHHIVGDWWHIPYQILSRARGLAKVLVVWVSMDPHPPDGSWGCGSPTMPAHSAGWPGRGVGHIQYDSSLGTNFSDFLLNFGWIYWKWMYCTVYTYLYYWYACKDTLHTVVAYIDGHTELIGSWHQEWFNPHLESG